MKNISTEQKHEIVSTAKQYQQDQNLNNVKLSTLCGVNEGYLSNILNSKFDYIPAGKTSPVAIPDKYFVMLAETVDYSLKKVFWRHVDTVEFKHALFTLNEAKSEQLIRTLVLPTGSGKSYTSELFKRVNALHTYVIKMDILLTINDLFNELALQLNIPNRGSKGWKKAQILIELRQLKRQGHNPLVVLDEAENMSLQMMRVIKGFIDGVKDCAGIVLVGTPKLWDLIEEAKRKDTQSGPQFYRRVKVGKREIKVDENRSRRYDPFFKMLGIVEKSFQKLLCELCDNYGELHDYVEPAMRKADEKDMPFNVDFFCMYHQVAKPKVA